MARTPKGQTRERIYRYVRDRLLAGAPPTVREMQAAMGFDAIESARKHLEALVAEGRLAKDAGRARGYRLPGARRDRPTAVPLLGDIPAGNLREAVEAPAGRIVVETRFPPEDLFALRVRGDSMTDAGILDGDVVIVHRQTTAQSGDIVAALVGEEATVKTLRLRGRRAVLEPANQAYPSMAFAAGELRILGRVVEVRRYLA